MSSISSSGRSRWPPRCSATISIRTGKSRRASRSISAREAFRSRRSDSRHPEEPAMNEDVFNTSIRKFLKTLGVTAQREIEKAVRNALADGRLKGTEKLPAKATVTIPAIGLAWEVKADIELA